MSGPASLDDLLAAHLRRFQASHERARAQAGPSLFGSDRAVDYWHFGHARRAIDEAMGDAVAHMLKHGDTLDPGPQLRKFVDDVVAELQGDGNAPPANEFGLRPAPEALAGVRQHGMERISLAQASLARGRLDPRLRVPRWSMGRDKWLLIGVVAVVLLAVLASI